MSYILKWEQLPNRSISEIHYKIPEIQRKLSIENVSKILDFQKNYYNIHNEYLTNQAISICFDEESGLSYLIDGQHRMNAYKILSEEHPERKIALTIDSFRCRGMENLEKIYEQINMNNPNPITHLGIDKYKIVKSFEEEMKKTFSNYFKNSEKPNRPHLNLDKMIDKIISENIIEKSNIFNGKDLFKEILELNKFYSRIDENLFDKWSIKDSKKIVEKIKEHPNRLYLGIFSNWEWIYRIQDKFLFNKSYEEMEHYSFNFRPKICKKIKLQIWTKINKKDLDGKCYCCGNYLSFNEFECGHIIPLSIGGQTNISNLMPICRNCNSDMGTLHLEEYKKKLEDQSK